MENKDNREEQDYLFVRVDKELIKIKYDEILFIEGMQNYIRIHTTSTNHMVLVPLKNVMDLLPSKSFYQVHKSYIVALDKVKAISGNQLILSDQKIPISRSKKEDVLAVLTNNKILRK